MKKILIIITILLAGITVNAQKWYVATTGSDTHGKGTLTDPWASVNHAADTVNTSIAAGFAGDTIFVQAGTYTVTDTIEVSTDVYLMGSGAGTVLKAGAALRGVLRYHSATEGTNGNQSISYITVDGDNTANCLVEIYARSNVKIHNCRFLNAVKDGVMFFSTVDRAETLTTTYSENNEFYSNYVYNCSGFGAYSGGWNTNHYGLGLGGQKNMKIHHNSIIAPNTGAVAYGGCIGFTGWGKHCGTKIYNNTLHAMPRQSSSTATGGWGFAIELWSQRGGIEIYDNDIKGSVDFGGYDTNDDEGYGYAIKIYDNNIKFDAISQWTQWGILLEFGQQGGAYVYKNTIENVNIGVKLGYGAASLIKTTEDVHISYNKFLNIRKDGATPPYGYGVQIWSDAVGTNKNLSILNNVFYTGVSGLFYSILQCNDVNTAFENINVINNITNYVTQPVRITTGTINTINIKNNIFYNGSTIYLTGATVTNYTNSGNLTDNPLFITPGTDFRLKANSPAINAGTNVSLTSDYDSNPIVGIPDIGAFEYQTLPVATTGLGWEDVLSKRNFKDDANFKKSRILIDAVPITATAPEINTLVGVTSGIQSQLDAKALTLNAAVATGTITDATGITSVMLKRYIYYSEAAATDITSNPQIVNGTAGQIITIIGSSDTNTLTLDDGDGLRLSAQCVLGAGDTITLYYDGTLADWIEIGRSNN